MRSLTLFLFFLATWALVYTIMVLRARKAESAPPPALPAPIEDEDGATARHRAAAHRAQLRAHARAAWGRFGRTVIAGLLVATIVTSLLSHCWIEVGPAQTMAVYDPLRGGIQNRDYAEGWHLLPPWVNTKTFSKRIQEYTMSIMQGEGAVLGDDSMTCQTKEGLAIKLDATVIFRIPENGAHTLWRTVGPDFVRVVVRPTTRNVVRLVVADYGIMEVYSNAPEEYHGQPGSDFYVGRRQEIEDKIGAELRRQFAEKGLDTLMFLLRNISYESPEFETAIVNKQIAQQQVVTQQFLAEAMKIHASAQVKRAEGESRAIQLKAQALRINSGVVDLEWIDQLKPDQVILLPGNVTPLLPLPGTGAGTPARSP